MSNNILGFKQKVATTAMTFALLAALVLAPSMARAATHDINLSAEVLPNGQFGYKRGDRPAVIPGPTLFVKQGDTVNITVINNTGKPAGFKVPGLSNTSAAKAGPGGTISYSFNASKTGAHPYLGDGQELLGLFGAIVVDSVDGKVERYVDGDGAIKSVKASELDKQYVLFMVGSTFWGTEISKTGTQTPLWTNPVLGAVEEDIVRFHILSAGPGHTFHLHAHRWFEPGTNSIIDVKLMADGSDGHTFTLKAGTGVGPGHWQYHCHLFSHMEAGMHGSFRVDANKGSKKGPGNSVAGASPHGAIFGNASDDPGLVTFVISDEPASWYRSARADTIFKITGGTRSLEVIPPGSSVNFIMAETNTVHTMTSLLWPSGADDPINGHHAKQHSNHGNHGNHDKGRGRGRDKAKSEHASMPFDQSRAYKGGGIVKLTTPGLYVFTCKVHPYMFGAVIVDDPATDGLDLGESIDLATGIVNLPTSSDLATRLLRIFFIATAPNNWQDFTSTTPWKVTYPSVPVRITGGAVANLSDVLIARYGNDIALTPPIAPAIPGVGEVWVDTQFEKTAGKTKPGTITVVDASTWKPARKIALPQINMNNPHNMWTNRDQSVVYQTQWFDNKLTMINKKTGALIKNIQVGEAPAHVMTRPDNDDITVTNNGEDGMSMIPAGTTEVARMMPTQKAGQPATNPHGHWISVDGNQALAVTPNIFTSDVGFYDINSGGILERTPTGDSAPGAHPIAIGMMPDASKFYAANLLHHSVSVINKDGTLKKTINLIADYNPIDGTIVDRDSDGQATVGMLPIQLPVSPDGRAVVVANMGQSIIVIDTATDKVAKMLPCDAGCHGANFGAKKGGGYYAYVTSKFSNELIVVDADPNNDGDLSDAMIAGRVSLVSDGNTQTDDRISSLAGYGGQGVLAIPNVYNSWVKNLPGEWKDQLTPAQQNASRN
ncbi:beta-propeller fold lactonase family protein [Nitrosovibrio tenuis]|uniref:DNA-binding beta-propeller fold protein YncE n=1 Tax=Nitrosovibrio tenuis TaxID=1233 RepID=A0A1H7LPF0_9PROT|nr:beta-propeller fold lactonase family protein [Nitrosovibrio tenuis]SEL00766.1 DNA-binding beta-propeller fold protein YncE [Nitrosovibrio tenuis]